MRVEQDKSGYTLKISLPGIEKDRIQITKKGDELNIRIGNHRRNLVLPQALATLKTAGAEMENELLKINFEEEIVKKN